MKSKKNVDDAKNEVNTSSNGIVNFDSLHDYAASAKKYLNDSPVDPKRIAVGGLTFWSTLLLSHIAIPLSAASRMSTPLGYLTIFSASVATGVADFALKDKSFSFSINDLENHKFAGHVFRYLIACPLIYSYLGGFPYSIFPSDFARIGAFRTAGGHIPATMAYADKNERAIIHQFGEQYGCHTCGTRKPSKRFIADHMPPIMDVKRYNNTFWRKYFPYFTREWKQRFYPQCNDCSLTQGHAVKTSSRVFKYHMFSTVRMYHLSGAIAVIFNMIFEGDD